MPLHFRDGYDFERRVFGLPDRIILESLGTFKPTNFRDDVSRIIKSFSRGKSHERFPRTSIAETLYFGVRKSLGILGVKTNGLRLFSLLGTDADRYYETDALFYLPPSCGCECIVTIDAWLIGTVSLMQLRDYWIESSGDLVYSEVRFQGDLFAHSRILAEYLKGSTQSDRLRSWAFSSEYKNLWERGYLPTVPDRMVDRPVMRPENHLILTPHHLEKWGRESFVQLVATELWKQICIQNLAQYLRLAR